MASFATYSEAKRHADKLVKDMARGSQAAALTAKQSRDALAALQTLEEFRVSTGRRVSLLAAVSDYCEHTGKLSGYTLGQAVAGFLANVAHVERKDLAVAVEDFITAEEPRTKASDGQRAQLSPKYHYNRAIMLRRFAATYPNLPVCDLAKEHLDGFLSALGKLKSKGHNPRHVVSAKARNHHRAAIRQFLQWAVRKDYLAPNHRLGEADSLRLEHANDGAVEFYTPGELKALLDVAQGPMLAMLALGGLAGLRTAELLRLDWADVWRVENHIEITAGKSKTRQRRLIEVCPALAAWLDPFRNLTVGKIWTMHKITFQEKFGAVCDVARVTVKGKKIPVARKANGLRHAFCSFHYALHANENATAGQAGNSPAMIHSHYKGLATKKEAEAWFNVAPEQAENVVNMNAAAKA